MGRGREDHGHDDFFDLADGEFEDEVDGFVFVVLGLDGGHDFVGFDLVAFGFETAGAGDAGIFVHHTQTHDLVSIID